MRASTLGAFQEYGVAKVAHLSGSIDDELVDPSLHPPLLAAQQAHVWREPQAAIARGLIQRFSDTVHRFDLHPFPRLQIETRRWRGLALSPCIGPQQHPANFPKQEYTHAPDHFQRRTVPTAD